MVASASHPSEIPDSRIDARPPPHCVLVTGPRGAGKTRTIQQRILALAHTGKTPVLCGVLLIEEGRTRMDRFVADRSGLALRKLALPCPCCPALARLPDAARAFAAAAFADWLFVEMPWDAAAGLAEEFDHALGWPRSLVVCLNEGWTTAWRRQALSPFQLQLIESADEIIEVPDASPTTPFSHDIP